MHRSFLLFQFSQRNCSLRPRSRPRTHPQSSAFSLLLTAYSLLFLPSCKDVGVPPDRILPDTTSHNFTWTVDTLGDGNASNLKDVFILDENNIWAVGEIYLKDSTGQFDPNAYNLAQWNGVSWTLHRIQFYTICGQASRTPYPASAVWAFSETDIWIAMDGSQVARWNGSLQTATMCLPISFSINKMWAESPSSIYVVGSMGNILHYTGSSWEKIESGTTTDINDVWGVAQTTLAVVSDRTQSGEYRILTIDPTGARDTLGWTLQRRLYGVWFSHESPIYECGSGVRQYVQGVWQEISLSNYFSTRVRGSSPSNIFVVGAFGFTAHYNGSTWREYPELRFSDGSLEGLAVSERLILAVGYAGTKAIVIRGTMY